jgi:hypothetical protein
MIALQGDENRYWTRPIGLISTALVTGLTSALVSFHVSGNIDKLIDIYSNIAAATNKLELELVSKTGGRAPAEIQDQFKNDKDFRDWYWSIVRPYVESFNKSKVDALKIYGSAAELNSVATPKLEPEPAKPASP